MESADLWLECRKHKWLEDWRYGQLLLWNWGEKKWLKKYGIKLKVYGTNGLNGSLKVFTSNEKSKNKK